MRRHWGTNCAGSFGLRRMVAQQQHFIYDDERREKRSRKEWETINKQPEIVRISCYFGEAGRRGGRVEWLI